MEDKLIPSEASIEDWYSVSNNGKPIIVKGEDLSALAGQMGIDAEGLAATVANYNEMCAAGKDTQFDKPDPVALKEGTYVIVEQKPRFATTLGGLKANENLQIVDAEGNPIANLYGAGCVVGGANGKTRVNKGSPHAVSFLLFPDQNDKTRLPQSSHCAGLVF